MVDRLTGKVALITGGARGQGREAAELFMREGATAVYAADVLEPDDAEGSPVTFVKLDVTNDAEWEQVVNAIIEEHGQIDILVNNAAIYLIEPILETTNEIYDRILDVNLKSIFYGMRAVLPHMVSRKSGSIVNVASIWGLAGVPVAFAYQTAKGAILNMSKNVAITHGQDGIRCNSLHPGYILTPMNADQPSEISQALIEGTPMKRAGTPIETAYAALFLASDEASFVTGTSLVVDGEYLAP
jgi:NAD(P)-dependent dehydrogenase (short-subunit alcohol dehydrogenase family)